MKKEKVYVTIISGNVTRQNAKIRRTMDNLMTINTLKLSNDDN